MRFIGRFDCNLKTWHFRETILQENRLSLNSVLNDNLLHCIRMSEWLALPVDKPSIRGNLSRPPRGKTDPSNSDFCTFKEYAVFETYRALACVFKN